MWGVSKYTRSQDRGLEHLSMQIHVENDEFYIIQRLERERRNGNIEKIDDNTYKYEVHTRDSSEMLPWIRTFICRIEKLTCSNHEIEEIFKSDLKKMYEMYGVGDTDGI